MLQPNPEKTYVNPFRQEKQIPQPLIEQYALERQLKILGTTATLLVLATNLPYLYDVGLNRNKDVSNTITLETIGEHPDTLPESKSITYYMNGFGTNNADGMTERLAPAMQLLSADISKSVHINDANYSSDLLANSFIKDAQSEGAEVINFQANSKSGIDVIQAIEKILEISDIQVKIVVLNEMPFGIDGLKAGSQQDMAVLMDMVSLIPFGEDSSYVQDAITVLMESERFTNEPDPFKRIGKFLDTFWDAVAETRNETRPSVRILQKQASTIANADLEAVIQAIGKMKGKKFMPSFYNVNSNPNYASIVDTKGSSEKTCKAMGSAGLYCLTLWLDSAWQRHTSYNFDTAANVKLFEDKLSLILKGPQLSEQHFANQRFDYFQKDTILATE